MYYNIKIKTLKGEYALESFEKDIIQREMDLYFASMYQASNEFKANIKELNISSDNCDAHKEVEQLKNFRKNVVENDSDATLDDFLSETIKEENKTEDIKVKEPIGFISFKNQPKESDKKTSDFKFNFKEEYENINKEVEDEEAENIEENQNQAQNELEELKEMQISPVIEEKEKSDNEYFSKFPESTFESIKFSTNSEEKIETKPNKKEISQNPSNNTLQNILLAEQEKAFNKTFNDNIIDKNLALQNLRNQNINPQMQPKNINNNAFADINTGIGSFQQNTINQNENIPYQIEKKPIVKEVQEPVAKQIQEPVVEEIKENSILQIQNYENPQMSDIQQLSNSNDFNKQIQQEAFEQYQQSQNSYEQLIEPYQKPVVEKIQESIAEQITEPVIKQIEQPIEQTQETIVEFIETPVKQFIEQDVEQDINQQPQEIKKENIIRNDLTVEEKIDILPDINTVKEENINTGQTASILKQPEIVKEIDYFTKDKPKKLERANFIENTKIVEKIPKQNKEETVKQEEKPKEKDNISKILNTVKNNIKSLDISSNEIDGDLLAVFEENNYDIIEFSNERIESVKKENENKEQIIDLTKNENKENATHKNLIDEYSSKQDENIEYDTIDVTDSMVHYESLNNLSEEKPFETFERKETEEGDNIISLDNVNQTATNTEEKNIQVQNTEQTTTENKEILQEQTVNNVPEQVQQNTNTPLDFKTYLADFIPEDIVDKFLICAYYIKNNLHQESFTIKSLNSKLFPATGELANMDVVNELLKKDYIIHLKSDTPKKIYTISPEGEKYFLENIRI